MRLLLLFGLMIVWPSTAVEAQPGVMVKSTIDSTHDINVEATKLLPDDPVGHHSSASNSDYWLYHIELSLDKDRDYDGFYSEFSLTMDIDTVFSRSDVYTIVYLGRDNRFESLYVSDTFRLFSDSGNDELSLDFELLSGYPSHDYHVLIEVYDAYSDVLLTYADNRDASALSFVPLESRNFDAILTGHRVDAVYGGTFSVIALLSLLILGVQRTWNRATK